MPGLRHPRLRRIRRIPQLGVLLAGVAVAVVVAAAPAVAHGTFVGALSGYPASSEQTLTLSVPNERDDTTFNVEVVLVMGDGWAALGCTPKATWTCGVTTVDGRPAVRFAKDTGAAPAEDETFVVRVRTAPTEGTVPFPVLQTYNTGEVVRWIGASSAANPAPRLHTLAGAEAPTDTAPTTTHGVVTTAAPPAPTAAPATSTPAVVTSTAPPTTLAATTTSVASTTTTSVATSTSVATPSTVHVAASAANDDDGGGGGSTGLVIAVAAVVVAAGAVTAVLVRRRRTPR